MPKHIKRVVHTTIETGGQVADGVQPLNEPAFGGYHLMGFGFDDKEANQVLLTQSASLGGNCFSGMNLIY
jgi:hypothetical protein